MKKTTRVIMAMIMVLGFAVLCTAQDLVKEDGDWVAKIEKTFKTKGTGMLRMEKVTGSVEITAWDKNEVFVSETKRMDVFSKSEAEIAVEKTDASYSQTGNTIVIGGPAFSKRWIKSSFVIKVPAGFSCDLSLRAGAVSVTGLKGDVDASTGGGAVELADCYGNADVSTGGGSVSVSGTLKNVEVSTGGGSVSVDNATGDRIDISTGGGEISISNASGTIKASTGGGEISITDASASIKASTGGGQVTCRNVGGSIRVSTGGGELDLKGIKGSIKASTGGGEINAELTCSDFSKDHTVSLSTGGGAISLSIPAKLPATIDAETRYRMSRRESKIISDFKLEINSVKEGDRMIVTAEGDINGGGDLIKLRTGGGNIHIKKN